MPPPPAVHSALDLISNTPLVKLRRTRTGHCQLFLRLECPSHGLDAQAERAELERTVSPHGYAVVTDNGGLVGVATEFDLLCDAERTPCETLR